MTPSELPFTFQAAEAADLPVIEALLTAAGLPLEGVRDHLAGFVLARRGSEVVGTAALERHGRHALLRLVAVRGDQRGTGLGQALAKERIRQAREEELDSLVLLTTTAEGFFPRFGFTRIAREEVPPSLLASRELQGVCPASSVILRLDLTTH